MHEDSYKNIRVAFFLNLGFSIFELVGGVFTNSVSIMSDSIHDFADALSIAVALAFEKKAKKEPNEKYTFGYRRFSLIGALITSIVLIVGSTLMLYNSIPRILNPEKVDYNGVLILAVIGTLVNGFGAYKTAKSHAINEKMVSLHLLEDVFGWIAVLVSGIVMKFFDLPIIDPILCIFITAFILFNVIKNIKSIFEVFLEKAPKDLDVSKIVDVILDDERVKDVHHIHVWSADSVMPYVTLHVKVASDIGTESIVDLKKMIKSEFSKNGIKHVTVEVEFESENCNSIRCV